MHYLRLLSFTLSVALALGACSSSAHTSSQPSDPVSPEDRALCGTRCDLEIAAGCSGTPENYATGCRKLCGQKYEVYPECEPALAALDHCRIDKQSYTCDASGMAVGVPIGGCGDEGQVCIDCTGHILNCL